MPALAGAGDGGFTDSAVKKDGKDNATSIEASPRLGSRDKQAEEKGAEPEKDEEPTSPSLSRRITLERQMSSLVGPDRPVGLRVQPPELVSVLQGRTTYHELAYKSTYIYEHPACETAAFKEAQAYEYDYDILLMRHA